MQIVKTFEIELSWERYKNEELELIDVPKKYRGTVVRNWLAEEHKLQRFSVGFEQGQKPRLKGQPQMGLVSEGVQKDP
jgi:hypothetical protein